MRYFDFQNLSSKINIRRATSRYLRSDVPEDIVISGGMTMAEVFWPSKYLPIVFKDQSTEDGIVAVKGTIMALVGQMGYFNSESIYHPIPVDTGTTGISTIPLGVDYAAASSVNTISSTNSYWAYPADHLGTMVIANGGSASTHTYTSYDEELGTIGIDENAVAAGDTIVLPANRPLGIAMSHIMSDVRGREINYNPPGSRAMSVYRQGYLNMPYVNWAKVVETYTGESGNFSASDSYALLKSKFPFAYCESDSTYPTVGDYVVSDVNGRFVVDGSITTSTRQTVGKLVAVDFKQPKDLLEFVDNKIGSGLAGTNTGGTPEVLFLVAGTVLEDVAGATPTISEVVDAVKAGLFGMARIDFDVR